MALAVVTKASGGLPITWVSAAPFALPITEATNGFGIAVTQVSAGGLPATYVTISGAIVSPLTPTNWNPLDKTASITLTNSNLTATATAATGAVRSAIGKSSGKYYFEVTMTTWVGSNTSIGLAKSTVTLPYFTSTADTVVLTGSGAANSNGTLVGGFNLGPRSSGNIIGIAVDLTAGLIWWRVSPSGSWNATSGTTNNPATGVGGVAMSPMSGTFFPALNVVASGDAAVANFGASAFSGVVPSGFTAGWG